MLPEDIVIERAALKIRLEALETHLSTQLDNVCELRELGCHGAALKQSVHLENLVEAYQSVLRESVNFEARVKINIPPV